METTMQGQPRGKRTYDPERHNQDGCYPPDHLIFTSRNWLRHRIAGRPSLNSLGAQTMTAGYERTARALARVIRGEGRLAPASDIAIVKSHADLDLALSAVTNADGWADLQRKARGWQRTLGLLDALIDSAAAYRAQLAAERAAPPPPPVARVEQLPSTRAEPTPAVRTAAPPAPRPAPSAAELAAMEAAMDDMLAGETVPVIEDDDE